MILSGRLIMSDAIIVENIDFSYENLPVLKNVSLRVRLGEVTAIMGENGAGKTTLIKHFNGLLKPQKGRVIVFGKDTREASVSELSRRVGIVFQNPNHQLFAETVEEEVAFAMKNFGFPPEKIEERVAHILDFMGLTIYKEKSPFNLSIGERKRVCIAAVLSYDPDVIVFDEPTAGQDHQSKLKLRRLIEELKSRRKGIVVVTHDVEFAALLADKVVILSKGRVLAEGPTRPIITMYELMRNARLSMPQIALVAHLLRKKGLQVRNTVVTPEELAVELIRFKSLKEEAHNDEQNATRR